MNEPPPTTGLIAGKYELVGMIGRGGMGAVWEGRHASLGTRVAIKFIDSEYADSEEARARFDNEARAAARIQSKYAIQIFDHGVTEDGRPYIVMEFLAGEPLDKRLDRLGHLSLQETARIMTQVCRALVRAHELGIIHRDLKPENVFLVRTPDDDEEIAKVLDFGIAKFKGPPGSSSGGLSSSTKTGAVLGTPFYMSPEQARGLKNVDHRTDLWSLGVIAYKCVTGVLPFEGESVGDLLVKICTAPLPVPSQRYPNLTAAFDAWFARALDREPERRFASATELADGLATSAGLAVRGGPMSQAYAATAVASSVPMSGNARTPYGSTPQPLAGTHPSGAGPYAPIASGTSAPFTTATRAARPASSGRGIVAASGIVFVLLAAGAFVFVTKMAGKKDVGADGNTAMSAAAAGITKPAPTVPAPSGATPGAGALGEARDAGALTGLERPSATVPTAKPTPTHGKPGTTPKPPPPPPPPVVVPPPPPFPLPVPSAKPPPPPPHPPPPPAATIQDQPGY